MEWTTVALQPSGTQLAALILFTIVSVETIRLWIRDRIERKGHPLPPGPTPLPLLGNVLSVNIEEPWLTYTAWRAKYGDMMYIQLLGSKVIVLNSYSSATKLLEKRSQLYSDRPYVATAIPYGQGANFAFAQYGPHWRLTCRILHQSFRAEAALAFRPMQLRRAHLLISNIIDDPKAYSSHYSTFSAAVAMSATYDYEPKPRDDPLVKLIDDFCRASLPGLSPGNELLLRVFPLLLSVPEWIPGLSWVRRKASKAYDLGVKVVETPYQMVRKRMAAREDIGPNTMVFDHIQRMEKLEGSYRAEYETAIKHASMTSFIGAAETTSSSLLTFTLAMVENPRVWKRAQAEIDAVIGTGRLPDYEDRPSLPYVNAIFRETLRWNPVVPLSIPHAALTDDVYDGYFIPRGTSMVTNVWCMSRDESRYPDGDSFIPERFLDSDGTLGEDDPAQFIFGFGRRICPGRHTADASVWIGMATMLATLDFNPAKDESGNDIEFEPTFVNGITHRPAPFPCSLTPRAHITKEILNGSLAH